MLFILENRLHGDGAGALRHLAVHHVPSGCFRKLLAIAQGQSGRRRQAAELLFGNLIISLVI